MNRVTLTLPLLILAACANGESDAPDTDWLDSSGVVFDQPVPTNAEFHPTRVIVGFKDQSRPRDLMANQRPLRQVRDMKALGAAVYEVEAGASVVDAVEALRATGRYRWVEPDYVRHAFVNDPYLGFQWHMSEIGAEAAWATSTGSGVVVAVIDTGVSSGPYDGIGNIGAGYDFVNNDSDASDDQGHGTHVAGTIAQATDNGAGVAGLAYDATIMPVKVLDSSGSGYTSDIVSGINWAVSNGADVINMSLGSSYYSSSEAAAVLNAYNNGVFVAAASGNESSSSVGYPAAYSGAVAVGATGQGGYVAYYSNQGSALDLVAPGGDLGADVDGDGYADGVLQETFSGSSWSYYFFEGTSMASPHVAAAAALLMAEGASNAEAEDALVATAQDIGSSGWDTASGHGLIQVADALAYYQGNSSPAADDDGDGYDEHEDCDDSDASVNPGAAEICEDGIDQDCDGYDEACPAADNDGDGWDENEDCDDGDASVNPGAAEICEDGIDQDCDGYDEVCPPADNDGDGYDETVDCDDNDASVNPGAVEVCEDGIDQDCDGVDDTCAVGPTISNVSHYAYSRRWRVVEWTTDVDTYGEVCNDRGNCYYTEFGTYHWGYVRNRGSSLYITAVDGNGAVDSVVVSY